MLKLLHCTEMMTNPPTAAPATYSPAAERMRAHRQRRRDGLRCLTIELRETEIDALARNGFLKADTRNDPCAIEMSLYKFLARISSAPPEPADRQASLLAARDQHKMRRLATAQLDHRNRRSIRCWKASSDRDRSWADEVVPQARRSVRDFLWCS